MRLLMDFQLPDFSGSDLIPAAEVMPVISGISFAMHSDRDLSVKVNDLTLISRSEARILTVCAFNEMNSHFPLPIRILSSPFTILKL